MKKIKIGCICLLIFNLVVFILNVILNLKFYRYPLVNGWGNLLINSFKALIPFVIILLYFIFERKMKKVIRIIFIIVLGISIPIGALFNFLFRFSEPFISQTSQINNYMKTDNDIHSGDLNIFPQSISENATEIKYYYQYRNTLDPDYDIFMECKLPHDEYESEKKRIISLYPNLKIADSELEPGYIDYRVAYENWSSYDFCFVSFSDSTYKIRYIKSYAMDDGDGSTKPYFMKLAKNKK